MPEFIPGVAGARLQVDRLGDNRAGFPPARFHVPVDINYVNAVIGAFAAQQANLGQFPAPAPRTITATEVLKNHLPAANYAGAVCVIELQAQLRPVFVVSNSGAANAFNEPGSQVDFRAADTELATYMGRGARFVYGNQSQDFYNPLHDNTVQHLVNTISPAFNGTTNLVTQLEATAVDTAMRQAFLQPLGHGVGPGAFNALHVGQQNYWNQRAARQNQLGASAIGGGILYGLMQSIRQAGQNVLPVNAAAQNAVRDMMALALAIRLRLCSAAQMGNIVTLMSNLIRDLRTRAGMDTTGSLSAMATHAEHLYQLQHSVYVNNQPPAQCGGTGAVFNAILAAAWQMLGQSRFCAEPKAFGYIRNANHDGRVGGLSSSRLIGETCIWWTHGGGPQNPAGYQVIGPQGSQGNAALAGSYMWACPSCRNRSAAMVAGLPRGPLQGAGRIGVSHEI